MHAAALQVALRLPGVQSLKEKRHRLKAMSATVRKTFPVGFAETDHQDLWQRATVGIAIVAPEAGQLDRVIHTLRRHLDTYDTIEVLSIQIAYMEDWA